MPTTTDVFDRPRRLLKLLAEEMREAKDPASLKRDLIEFLRDWQTRGLLPQLPRTLDELEGTPSGSFTSGLLSREEEHDLIADMVDCFRNSSTEYSKLAQHHDTLTHQREILHQVPLMNPHRCK